MLKKNETMYVSVYQVSRKIPSQHIQGVHAFNTFIQFCHCGALNTRKLAFARVNRFKPKVGQFNML